VNGRVEGRKCVKSQENGLFCCRGEISPSAKGVGKEGKVLKTLINKGKNKNRINESLK